VTLLVHRAPPVCQLNLDSRGPLPSAVRKNWRKVVGMFRDSEFMQDVDEECLRMRAAARR